MIVSGTLRTILVTSCVIFIATGICLTQCGSKARHQSGPKPNAEYQHNLKTLNLKGPVKSIKEVNYKQFVTFDELENFITKVYYFFDATGNLAREVKFLEEEQFHTDYTFTYDEANNYTTLTAHDEQGNFSFKEIYAFDPQGRLIERSEYKQSLKMRYRYKYDDLPNGYIERKIREVPPDDNDYIYIYIFDPAKHTKTVTTQTNGASNPPKRKEVTCFDTRGNTIERVTYEPIDHEDYRYTATYDSANRITHDVSTFSTRSMEEYNTERKFIYDIHDNITQLIEKKAGVFSKKSFKACYVYDTHGNWIKKELFRMDGTPKTSIERIIEYY
jgi:hypothetical protein